MGIDRARIAELTERERGRFAASHPRSRELHQRAEVSLLSGVPMNWMTRWPGAFPVFVASLPRPRRVVEINDLGALERELAHGDVACVLVEPALTNIGIVLAEPGYHDGLRELTRAAGTLLVIDETHPVLRTRRLHGGPRARPGFPHDRQGDRRRGTDRCPGRPPRPRLRRGNRRADEMMQALPRGRATR